MSPKSTTYMSQNVFLQITMYNFSPQYLRQLENSNRHSNSSLCTQFCKKFVIWFRCVVQLFSLDKPDLCRNWLLQVRLSKRILELLWSDTCLTSFYKNCLITMKEKISITCIYKTHKINQIQYKICIYRVLYTESGKFFSRVPNGRLLSNLGGSVGRSDSGVVVLVVLVGAEFSLSSSSSTIIGLAAVYPIWKSSKMDREIGVSIPGQ